LLLQLRDLLHHVAIEHRSIAPPGLVEGRGHNVLRHAVQPVRPLAAAGLPSRGEVFVTPPAQQQSLGAQRFTELGLGPLLAVLVPDLKEPAAVPEALLTGRVLDDSIEREVLANDDLSHVGSPWPALSATSYVDTVAPETGRRPAAHFALG